MITCRDVDHFLDEYLEGTLDPQRKAIFELHLKLCPPCVTYLSGYRKSTQLARAACEHGGGEADELPDELLQAVLAATAAPPSEPAADEGAPPPSKPLR